MSETTICTRFPDGTVKEIDELVKENYYKNRSDAVRSLVRTCLMINKKDAKSNGDDSHVNNHNHDPEPAPIV